jgi:hypothetical protein
MKLPGIDSKLAIKIRFLTNQYKYFFLIEGLAFKSSGIQEFDLGKCNYIDN